MFHGYWSVRGRDRDKLHDVKEQLLLFLSVLVVNFDVPFLIEFVPDKRLDLGAELNVTVEVIFGSRSLHVLKNLLSRSVVLGPVLQRQRKWLFVEKPFLFGNKDLTQIWFKGPGVEETLNITCTARISIDKPGSTNFLILVKDCKA
jgi:hypothetical protein